MKGEKENLNCCCGKDGAARSERESDSAPEHCNCGDSGSSAETCCCGHKENAHSCHCAENSGNSAGHCCCKGTRKSCGCCQSEGGIKYHGLKLWVSAASIAASFIAGFYADSIPYYPLTDPAWIAVILCSIPIFRAAGESLFRDGKITSALLVSIAMIGAFALQIAELSGL